MTHFLQTKNWETYQQSVGNETVRRDGSDWTVLAIQEPGLAHTPRLYAPYGPSFSSLDGLSAALASLEQAAASAGAVYVRVEPTGETPEAETGAAELLQSLGYKRVNHVQPEDTWMVNLEAGPDAVLKGMDKSNRKRWRRMERLGIEIRVSEDPADVPTLCALMAQVGERNEVELRDSDYVQAQADCLMPLGAAKLYLAILHEKDEETGEETERVVAANLVLDGEDTRILIHNGSDADYYKTGANVAMQVQILLDASEQGKSWADFYAMAPEGSGPDHPWAGFTKFKQSFGGEARHYLGTWEKPVKNLRYAVYSAARKLSTLV